MTTVIAKISSQLRSRTAGRSAWVSASMVATSGGKLWTLLKIILRCGQVILGGAGMAVPAFRLRPTSRSRDGPMNARKDGIEDGAMRFVGRGQGVLPSREHDAMSVAGACPCTALA